jgi:hypothetical protein
VSEFVSIVFEDQYFSSLQCVVEATLLDFRFRLKSFKSVMSELASFQERGITVKSANEGNGKNGKKDSKQKMNSK